MQKKTNCLEDYTHDTSSKKYHGNKENEGDENVCNRNIMQNATMNVQKEDDVRATLSVQSEKKICFRLTFSAPQSFAKAHDMSPIVSRRYKWGKECRMIWQYEKGRHKIDRQKDAVQCGVYKVSRSDDKCNTS